MSQLGFLSRSILDYGASVLVPIGGYGGAGIFTAMLVYVLGYTVIYPALAGLLPGGNGYKQLSEPDKAEWRTRVLSNVHAVAVVVGVLPALSSDSKLWDNHVSHFDERVSFWQGILVGYFIADLIVVIMLRDTISGFGGTVAHHVFSILAFGTVLNYKCIQFWACFFTLGEISTPFINQRWFMSKCSSFGKLYVANGIAMVVVFGAVRVFHLPWSAYAFWNDLYAVEIQFGFLVRCCFALMLVFNISINVWWFSLIVKGAIKKLTAKKKA